MSFWYVLATSSFSLSFTPLSFPLFFFFFSSRRRHTRSLRDWSRRVLFRSEIYDQPQAIRNALMSRFFKDFGTANLEGLRMEMGELLDIERILILGCGTSWNAGYVAA